MWTRFIKKYFAAIHCEAVPFLKRLGSFFAFILFFVGAMEVLLRFFPAPKLAENIVVSSVLGVAGAALQNGYNRLGFLDQDFDPLREAENGHFRVVFLGDEVTQAPSVSSEQRFTKILPHLLVKGARSYVFSGPEYGMLQEVLAYRKYGGELRPNLVIHEFFGFNDFVNDNVHFANQTSAQTDSFRPYFLAGSSSYRFTYFSPKMAWLREHSVLVRDLAILFHRFSPKIRSDVSDWGCDSAQEMFLSIRDPLWEDGILATKKIVHYYKSIAAANPGTVFVSVYFPSAQEIVDKVWRDQIENPLHKCYPGEVLDRRAGERLFFKVFKESGFPSVSLWGDFISYPNRAELYNENGELSVMGHKLAAKALAQALKRFVR